MIGGLAGCAVGRDIERRPVIDQQHDVGCRDRAAQHAEARYRHAKSTANRGQAQYIDPVHMRSRCANARCRGDPALHADVTQSASGLQRPGCRAAATGQVNGHVDHEHRHSAAPETLLNDDEAAASA
jgi:hypothetical protein